MPVQRTATAVTSNAATNQRAPTEALRRIARLVAAEHGADQVLAMQRAAQENADDVNDDHREHRVRQALMQRLEPIAAKMIVAGVPCYPRRKAQCENGIDRDAPCRVVTDVATRRESDERLEIADYLARAERERAEERIAAPTKPQIRRNAISPSTVYPRTTCTWRSLSLSAVRNAPANDKASAQ